MTIYKMSKKAEREALSRLPKIKQPKIDIDALVAEAVPPKENPQLAFTMPVRVDSETNGREHWTKKWRRKKKQQEALFIEWNRVIMFPIIIPCAVRFTRVGPKKLDDDNLRESFKAIRDGVAGILKIDDGDERITWEYAQVAVGKRVYSVRVEVY